MAERRAPHGKRNNSAFPEDQPDFVTSSLDTGEPLRNPSAIALNVTRTRVTLLVFNLTIISLMLSTIVARGGSVENHNVAHLTSYVALFVGFCLTLLGILWLLFSQDLDAHGLSRPWPFAFGTITTYLALSQTLTAFMHEFLVGFESVIEATEPGVGASTHHALPFDALDRIPLLILLVLGGVSWALTTYVAPLLSTLKSPVPRGRRWWFAAYYFTLQVPIYWVYAHAWHLQYAPAGEPMNMPVVFALQFIQPLLWIR